MPIATHWLRISRHLTALLLLVALSPCSMALEVRSWMSIRSQGVVLQELDMSCGAASIAMVLDRLYGQRISEEKVLEVMETGPLAATVSEMVKAIDALGYQGKAVALDFATLATIKTPVILFIRSSLSKLDIGHFVVLERVTEDGVVYRDPTFGNRVIDVSTFRSYWETREDPRLPGLAIAILPRDQQQRDLARQFVPLRIEPVIPLQPAF